MYDDLVYEGKFIWNRSKNELNKKRHKISFETASLVFDDPLAMVVYDFANSTYNEDRYRLTGFLTSHSAFVSVSFTTRMELTRIFSARKADENEKDEYIENARRYFV
jgi:uncharacterized DUF497 family protein